ncbi:MAG TPA: DUF4160 domain-containing protein [Bacteroidia bacterium]|nr:DUF4160 domain-containing protein [Bacteroidia bacterium]
MPTILYIAGWRFFFYSNESNEPVHIHAQKAGKEAKYWLKVKEFEIVEAFSYKLSPNDKREVKKIIYAHFDYFVEQWNNYFKK